MNKLNLSYRIFVFLLLIIFVLIITAFVDFGTSAIALAYVGSFIAPVLLILILIDRLFNKEYKKGYFNWSFALILIIGAVTIYIYNLFSNMNFLI